MHISEGILALPVLSSGWFATTLGLAIGLRRMNAEEIPKVALLTAAFFVASLVHLPLGPSSAHLILNGVLGILLGWAAFPAIFIGLFFQTVLFQFGGLTTLGVNTMNMAIPAVIMGILARPGLKSNSGSLAMIMSAIAGAGAVIISAAMAAGSLALSGEPFTAVGKLIFIAHIPIAVAEGVLSALIILFLLKTRPEIIKDNMQFIHSRLGLILVIILVLIGFSNQVNAHRVNLFAWYDGNMILAEGYFSSGKKAVNAKIMVFDSEGENVFNGLTDAEGEFSYKPLGNGG
jgi:cobalt/nickel transport system permease protein